MAAGFLSGITEALVIVTPFEVVKIRLQQQKGLDKAALKYQGPVHCALTIVKEEGPLGLWSGAAPTIFRNGTNQMCLFWAKNNFDKFLWGKHEGDGVVLLPYQSMISGFSAALIGPVATGPFDVVKTRLMAQQKAAPGTELKYKGFIDALIKIPREEVNCSLSICLLCIYLRRPLVLTRTLIKFTKERHINSTLEFEIGCPGDVAWSAAPIDAHPPRPGHRVGC